MIADSESIFECIKAYWQAFPNNDGCGLYEPDGVFCVEYGDRLYKMPENETKNAFMDRIKRSKTARKNLFFDEWQEYTPDRIEGADY